MAKCKHCDGTGEVPDRCTLECVSCQRKVTVTVEGLSTAEIIALCENVRCAECNKAIKA